MSTGKEILKDLRYSQEHEWVKSNGDGTVLCGLTDYAQNNLGDIVFVELSLTEGSVQKDDTIAVVESAKAASDVYSPVTGEIISVNSDVETSPEIVNESPYEKGWLFKIALSDEDQLASLMSSEEYLHFIEND